MQAAVNVKRPSSGGPARRRALAAVCVAVGLLAAGCGSGVSSSSGDTTTTGAVATTVADGLDPCVVGSWTSTAVTLTFNDPDTGNAVQMTGGAGEQLVLNPDGSYTDDVSNIEVLTGDAGGSHYELKGAGTDTGHFTTQSSKITITSADPSSSTATMLRDGQVIATSDTPAESTDDYVCTAGESLETTTSSGIVVEYAAT